MEFYRHYVILFVTLLPCFRDPVIYALGRTTVIPKEPLVLLGGNINITCQTTCKTDNPWWTITDESEATQTNGVLLIKNATFNDEGRYTCTVGKCGKAEAHLTVISFPDPVISAVPKKPVFGQPFKIVCRLNNIKKRNLDVNMFLQPENEVVKFSENGTQDGYYNYTSVSVGMADKTTEYRCNTTLRSRGEVLTKTVTLSVIIEADTYTQPMQTVMSYISTTENLMTISEMETVMSDARGKENLMTTTPLMKVTNDAMGPTKPQRTNNDLENDAMGLTRPERTDSNDMGGESSSKMAGIYAGSAFGAVATLILFGLLFYVFRRRNDGSSSLS
ncbi:hypothetical protein AGOR_G00147060 [Albula goreensis]|uniref:Ig-like domain-containing protein n=1 Tax=Albula goreensis TaxID=1534307 RepID=A0A8T3DA88_9TELE|nr:hypothetical protein AGOR_G00147060 [Albula goreensis]